MNKFLIADLVVHILVVTKPNIGHKLIECILWVVLPGKLLVKVHLHQTSFQLHEAQVTWKIFIVNSKTKFAVFIVFSQMVLEIDIIFIFSVENISEVSRLVYKDHFVKWDEVAQGELLHRSGAIGAKLDVEGL